MPLVIPTDSYASVLDVQRRSFLGEFEVNSEPSIADVEAELLLSKTRIDGTLKNLGSPFENSFAVKILGSIQTDLVAEKITPLQLDNDGRLISSNFAKWREDLRDVKNGDIDLGGDGEDDGCVYGFTNGQSYLSCDTDVTDPPVEPPVDPPAATVQVGVAWSSDDMIDDAEIVALETSTSRMLEIPALPAGESNAHLILWTADASGDIMGVRIAMQFGDQLNIFDNANAQAETVEMQAGMARITINPIGAASAGQILTVTF